VTSFSEALAGTLIKDNTKPTTRLTVPMTKAAREIFLNMVADFNFILHYPMA
jgi:hypothetical protein